MANSNTGKIAIIFFALLFLLIIILIGFWWNKKATRQCSKDTDCGRGLVCDSRAGSCREKSVEYCESKRHDYLYCRDFNCLDPACLYKRHDKSMCRVKNCQFGCNWNNGCTGDRNCSCDSCGKKNNNNKKWEEGDGCNGTIGCGCCRCKCTRNRSCVCKKCKKSCTTDSQCKGNERCITPSDGGPGYCSVGKNNGAKCKENEECRSLNCTNNICQPQNEKGTACQNNTDCEPTEVCVFPIGSTEGICQTGKDSDSGNIGDDCVDNLGCKPGLMCKIKEVLPDGTRVGVCQKDPSAGDVPFIMTGQVDAPCTAGGDDCGDGTACLEDGYYLYHLNFGDSKSGFTKTNVLVATSDNVPYIVDFDVVKATDVRLILSDKAFGTGVAYYYQTATTAGITTSPALFFSVNTPVSVPGDATYLFLPDNISLIHGNLSSAGIVAYGLYQNGFNYRIIGSGATSSVTPTTSSRFTVDFVTGNPLSMDIRLNGGTISVLLEYNDTVVLVTNINGVGVINYFYINNAMRPRFLSDGNFSYISLGNATNQIMICNVPAALTTTAPQNLASSAGTCQIINITSDITVEDYAIDRKSTSASQNRFLVTDSQNLMYLRTSNGRLNNLGLVVQSSTTTTETTLIDATGNNLYFITPGCGFILNT